MVGQANRTLQSRLQSEQQASSSQGTRNRIVAAALMDLLDAKKALSATDSNGLQALAEKYNIDLEKLQRVSQYVNSPTVDPESVVRKVNEDGSERTTMKVRAGLLYAGVDFSLTWFRSSQLLSPRRLSGSILLHKR